MLFRSRESVRPRPVDSAVERRARDALLEAFSSYARGLVVLESARAKSARDFIQRLAERIPNAAAREMFLVKFRAGAR